MARAFGRIAQLTSPGQPRPPTTFPPPSPSRAGWTGSPCTSASSSPGDTAVHQRPERKVDPQDILDYTTLKSYSENHDQNEAIENTNVHILNSLHTREVDDNTGMCKLFYELEKEIHENNESKIHFCLHKKMDPKVVENILDSGEPGCTADCIKGFESCIGRRLIME